VHHQRTVFGMDPGLVAELFCSADKLHDNKPNHGASDASAHSSELVLRKTDQDTGAVDNSETFIKGGSIFVRSRVIELSATYLI